MRDQVSPFYVVCDESYSMIDHLRTLNGALRELYRFARSSPRTTTIRFCLIGFAESTRVLVPLSRVDEIAATTDLTARAATNFGVAFTTLRTTIQHDVEKLTASSCLVHRPAVFFLSDGQPTDPASWPAAYARLVDPVWAARPDIVAFGIGDADAATINRIGTVGSYLRDGTTSPASALLRFGDALTCSMELAADDGAALRVPRQVTGFTTLVPDAR